MKRTFLTTLAIAATVCGIVLFAQSAKSSALDRQLSEKREAITYLEKELTGIAPVNAMPTADARAVADAAIAEARAASTPEQRIANALNHIRSLTAEVGDVNRSPAEFFKVFPHMLRLIETLDVDELIAVAEQLESSRAPGRQSAESVSRMLLLLLAAEHDPEQIIQNPEHMANRELATPLIGILARRDPVAAMARIEELELPASRKRNIRGRVAMQALLVDVETGIEMIRKLKAGPDGRVQIPSDSPIASDSLPAIIAAVEDPKNANVRSELTTLILNTASVEGGIAGARAQAENLEMNPEDLDPYFNGRSTRAFYSEPAAALDWMTETLPPDRLVASVPRFIARWAGDDYNAAGKWLGNMEPSDIRDHAIQKYSDTVSHMDPQGAAIWASEISDETLRSKTMKSVASQWLAKDRPGAKEWLESQGYTSESIGIPFE